MSAGEREIARLRRWIDWHRHPTDIAVVEDLSRVERQLTEQEGNR